MSVTSDSNKRIANNTLMLYFRMFITLIVGLYTSRVILDSLGVEDFGIYNVVGGFVAMFNVVRAGLVSATQRFITFDLGKGNFRELNRTFSTCVVIYIFLSVVVLIIAESIGVWFIDTKLNIPEYRLNAAHWVFQLSLLSLVVSLISFPYNALIISHEKMKAFAYISIYEVIAKLIVAYLLYITLYDKLIIYALLICFVQITVPLLYYCYSRKNFKESKILWILDWSKIKQIYSFTGWAMFGGIANIGFTEGVNMLLGAFFTPVVNAARGIAVQVQGIIVQFVNNFQLAVDPQIIKSFAKGDISYMSQLISSSSRISFFLLFFISLPVFLEADTLLGLWLVEVPTDAVLFLRLIMITTIYDAISNPYGKAIQANGDIKNYQLIFGGLLLLIVPVSYLVLKFGAPAYSVFVVHIILGLFACYARIYIADVKIGIPHVCFFRDTLKSIFIVVLVSSIIPLLLHFVIADRLTRLIVVTTVAVLVSVISVFYIGLNSSEKEIIINKVKSLYHVTREKER